jgi:hypothetical protein
MWMRTDQEQDLAGRLIPKLAIFWHILVAIPFLLTAKHHLTWWLNMAVMQPLMRR